MDDIKKRFYSLLMDIRIEGDEVERIIPIVERAIEETMKELNIYPDSGILLEKLSRVAKSIIRGHLSPIKDLAAHMLKEEIPLSRVGKLMFHTLRHLSHYAQVSSRTRAALERMAFAFIVTLSSEMNELFYRAVQRATGMSDALLRRLVRSQF